MNRLPMATIEAVGERGAGLKSVIVSVNGEAVASLPTRSVKTKADADGTTVIILQIPMEQMTVTSFDPVRPNLDCTVAE